MFQSKRTRYFLELEFGISTTTTTTTTSYQLQHDVQFFAMHLLFFSQLYEPIDMPMFVLNIFQEPFNFSSPKVSCLQRLYVSFSVRTQYETPCNTGSMFVLEPLLKAMCGLLCPCVEQYQTRCNTEVLCKSSVCPFVPCACITRQWQPLPTVTASARHRKRH